MNNKDTIYVDIDDEITTIIDKLRASDGRIVALVLPKRASVFQSIVNMKLLKRSAEAAKKHIVLVTTEASLMPLAGAVGLHVAPTPQSKPEIPSPGIGNGSEETAEEAVDTNEDDAYIARNARNRPIGELAGGAAIAAREGSLETIDLPDGETPAGDAGDTPRPAKDHRLKVPDFNKFRARLFLCGLALVLLAIGLYICLAILPKAAIAISTNASSVNVSLTMALDPNAQALDTVKSVIPAKAEQQQKTTSQQVPATGQKNNGEAATGSVIMNAGSCSFNFPDDVPAGTGVSTAGLTYITQKDASFTATNVSGHCIMQSGNVPITAQSAGSKYNVDSATFSVAGRSDVSASGSASGGTDDIVQIVAQGDIDSATQKLAAQDTSAVKSGLQQALLADGMYPLPATFSAGTPVVTASNKVGDQSANVTVTQAVTYTMYGVKKADLATLIKASVNSQINTNSQSILDDGLGKAKINVIDPSNGDERISLETVSTVGPDIDVAAIREQSAGKKIGDVKALIGGIPGVTNVEVRLSPFWVSSIPANTSKVTVTVSGGE